MRWDLDVWQKRYKQPQDKTIEDTMVRVASAMATGPWENRFDAFLHVLNSGYFIPGGRILANAGTPDGMLLNCFNVPVPDSRHDIFRSLTDGIEVLAHGGGVGFNFSNLRPAGSPLKSTGGQSQGPIPFINIFDQCFQLISKSYDKRQAAAIALLSLDHPDVLDFINAKTANGNGAKRWPTMNVSVDMPRNCVETLEDNQPLLKSIMDSIYECGDPGLTFLYRSQDDNNLDPKEHPITGVNPCQPGFATLLTPRGIRTFDEVGKGDVVWSGNGWTEITEMKYSGRKLVFKYTTNKGSFIGTENHRVLEYGVKVEVKDATQIDWATGPTSMKDMDPQDVMDGLVIGDGYVHKASNNLVLLCIGEDDQDYLEHLGPYIIKHRPGIKGCAYEIHTTITPGELVYKPNIEVPDRFFFGTDVTKVGFLRGLFSANGSVVGTRIKLRASSRRLIEQVQEMLSSVGIASYVTVLAPRTIQWPNGEYTSKESYDLNIASHRDRFMEYIGFIQQYKNARYDEITSTPGRCVSGDIKEITPLGEHDVFDITVACDSHTYWTGGLLVSNCGEVPLMDYGACCLGSINLSRLVKDSQIDYDELAKTVKTAVEFLTSVLYVTKYPGPAFEATAKKFRRIGLGVTGLAHALIKMNLTYGSKESLAFIDKVMMFIATNAYGTSGSMAQAFREGIPLRTDGKGFYHRVWDEKLPLFHSGLMAIAPTGSTSMLARTSSGIEPLFSLEVTRTDRGVEKITKDPLLESGEYGLWLFKTAMEVSPARHLAVLEAVQRWVDGSVSKTINVPENMDRSAFYEFMGTVMRSEVIKGMTVYRDKSLPEQVVVLDQPIQEGKIYEIPTPSGKVYVPIAWDKRGNIKQVFIHLNKPGGEEFAFASALGRVISVALQEGASIDRIIETLEGIGGGRVLWTTIRGKSVAVLSTPDAVAKVLADHVGREDILNGSPMESCAPSSAPTVVSTDKCLTCREPLTRKEGCRNGACDI